MFVVTVENLGTPVYIHGVFKTPDEIPRDVEREYGRMIEPIRDLTGLPGGVVMAWTIFRTVIMVHEIPRHKKS